MATEPYGPLRGHWNVEQAVISTLQTWLPEYLARVEEYNELPVRTIPRPTTPESIHGGLDTDSWEETELPVVIAVCKPDGDATYHESAGYSQDWEIRVGCIVKGEPRSQFGDWPEDQARAHASFYGTAVELLVQQGSLKGFAERTILARSPDLDYPLENERRFIRSTTVFTVSVTEMIREDMGPFGETPAESPDYGGEPEATPEPPPTVEIERITVAQREQLVQAGLYPADDVYPDPTLIPKGP